MAALGVANSAPGLRSGERYAGTEGAIRWWTGARGRRPRARLLAADNQVFAMARFSNPEGREKLEACGITCITHDLFDPFDDLPSDFDYVYYTGMPMSSVFEPLGRWPDSYDKYADATAATYGSRPWRQRIPFLLHILCVQPARWRHRSGRDKILSASTHRPPMHSQRSPTRQS